MGVNSAIKRAHEAHQRGLPDRQRQLEQAREATYARVRELYGEYTDDEHEVEEWLAELKQEVDNDPEYTLEDALRNLEYDAALRRGAQTDVGTGGEKVRMSQPEDEPTDGSEAEATSDSDDTRVVVENNTDTAHQTSSSDAEAKSLSEHAIELAADPAKLNALAEFLKQDRQSSTQSGKPWTQSDAILRAQAIGSFGLPEGLTGPEQAIIYQRASALLQQRTEQAASKKKSATKQPSANAANDSQAASEASASAQAEPAAAVTEQGSVAPVENEQPTAATATPERKEPVNVKEFDKQLLEKLDDINSLVKAAQADWKQRKQNDPTIAAFNRGEAFEAAALVHGVDFASLSPEQKRIAMGKVAQARKAQNARARNANQASQSPETVDIPKSPEEQRKELEARRENDRKEVAEALAKLDDEAFDSLDDNIKAVEATLAANDYAGGSPEDIYKKAVQEVLRIRGMGDPKAFVKLDGEYPVSLNAAVKILNADSVRRRGVPILPSTPPKVPVPSAPGRKATQAASNSQTGTPGSDPNNPTTSTPEDPTAPVPVPEVTPPSPESAGERPLVIAFVDETHDALIDARDAAEARLRDELQQGGRLKRFIQNIWKGEHGFARAYYLEKYKKEAIEKNERENDALANQSDDLEARKRAKLATLDRYTADFDELIHREAGESKEKIGHDSEFGRGIKKLLRDYATGEIPDAETFEEERGRLLQRMQDEGSEQLIGEGKVRIDNLMAIADQVKAMYEHQEDIDRALDGMKMYSGEARSNVRSEVQLGKFEKAVDWLNKRKLVGGLVGPVGIGVIASVALGIAKVGRGSVLRATGVTMVPGVLGGTYAAIRESKRIKQERELHSREMAQGKHYEAGAKRRDEIEATRYDTIGASELTAQLNELLKEGETPTSEQVRSAYEAIAAAEARVRLSDKRGIDLVSYSDVLEVERERQQLDIARALAKVRLGRQLDNLPSQFRTDFGIEAGQTVNQALEKYTAAVTELDADIDAKDAAFRKLRRRRVAIAGAVGFGTSLVAGLAAQEALAFANTSYDGLVEHMVKGGAPSPDGRQTVLEGWVHGKTAEHIAPSGTFEKHPFGAYKDALKVPNNYNVVTNADGTVTIEAPNGDKVAENLKLTKNGHLTKASLATLKDHNVQVIDKSFVDDSETTKKPKHFSVREYLKHHKGDTTHVKRDFWYDNNTPAPNFDKNELGLDWGGEGHKGAGANDSIKMTVGGMTSGGSYHHGEQVSWREAAKSGDLKIAVSGSRSTQSDVFMIKVKPDGTVTIPEDHPARKFFTIDKNGQAHFKGGYVEVVEIRGDKGGTTHIAPLATVVGENSVTKVKDTVEVPVKKNVPRFKLIPPAIETQGREVEGFGMPGYVPRRPLERVSRERSRGDNGYTNYSYYRDEAVSQELYDRFAGDFSPRIRNDEQARLSLGEEVDWYHDHVVSRDGQEYATRIDELVEDTPELKDLSADIELIDTIPVAAAAESETIYDTIALFARQDEETRKKAMLLLNVNWLNDVKNNPAEAAAIQKTLSEIERARKDFPWLQVAVIQREYDRAQTESTKGVIGYVARDMINAALFAARKSIHEGRRPADKDILIQRNDADTKGISRHHFRSMLRAATRYPKIDVYKGVTRYDTASHVKYPGFGIAVNLQTNLSNLAALRGVIHTGGANFAARASAIAATGGLGTLRYSGAASDDVEIGRRIRIARRKPGADAGYSGSGGGDTGPTFEKISMLVGGATIDTNADRFLPRYLGGKWWQSVWDETAGEVGFADGPGMYSRRDQVSRQKSAERLAMRDDEAFRTLELNISEELGLAPEEDRKRVLSLIFKQTPGAYTLKTAADGKPQFTLTKAGRAYVKQWIKKDAKGRRHSFGSRQLEALYGHDARGRKTGKIKPLVANR